ncbi:MAG: Jag N-terminal domain-containing protein, partial [Spirochaetaceae bacterium]|nr:Jag N-terminal domain-containing protein [Spirochaetaceae bacterium]
MVNFVQLQQIMKERLEQDRGIRIIEAAGSTLEEAVSEAAAILSLPIRRLEYEVIERGFPGVLGKGKKDWKIRVYERVMIKKEEAPAAEVEKKALNQISESMDKDGDVFVHLYPQGAFIKVIPPVGKGKKVSEIVVMDILNKRIIKDIDVNLMSQVVKEAAGVYVKVGYFESNPVNDAYIKLE